MQNQQGPIDPRFAIWIGTTILLFFVAMAVGLVLLPSAQRGSEDLSFWASICRAVGMPIKGSDASREVVTGEASSRVAWTTATRQLLADGSADRGLALATVCDDCHGDAGISGDAAFPNLAGQSAAAIYKQLQDFKSGARSALVMGVYVAPLSLNEMVDLSSYYASLPSPDASLAGAKDSIDPVARRLSEFGAPMRGVAGCAACHSPQGLTQGAPRLEGQQRAYLEQQLQAFKTAMRQNDISAQMRSVARQLTESEIAKLAAYYSEMAAGGSKP